jgi:hypothetical protein
MWHKLIFVVGMLLLLSPAAGSCQTPEDVEDNIEVDEQLLRAQEQRTRAFLQLRVTIRPLTDKVNLGEALDYLADQYEYPTVFFDHAFWETQGIKGGEKKRVAIRGMKNVSKGAALESVLLQAGAWYEIRGDCIFIVPWPALFL